MPNANLHLDLTLKDKQMLLTTARHAIQYGLAYPRLELSKYSQVLQQQCPCFVILKETNQLRGSSGCSQNQQPLIQNVAQQAFNAAFKDKCFRPVNHIEEPILHISIAIVENSQKYCNQTEKEVIKLIAAKISSQLKSKNAEKKVGIQLKHKNFQATFLPEKCCEHDSPDIFIQQLKKAIGVEKDEWFQTIETTIFRCEVID